MASFKPREVISILERLGFIVMRQAGSHVVMYNKEINQIISVPKHTKDVKRGLLLSIIKKARSSEKEFLKLR